MIESLCIVQDGIAGTSETFLQAHAERLPVQTTVVHDPLMPRIGGDPVLSQSALRRAGRKVGRAVKGRPWNWEVTAGFMAAFRRCRPQAVLAEYGPTGVAVLEACRLSGLPLVVHFHGYDASRRDVLARYAEPYTRLFQYASAIIAVSTPMYRRLLDLGAPREKLHVNPCGVDCGAFNGAEPDLAGPEFLAVGRLVEKKGPHLTLLAFSEVYRRHPEARLRIVGEGRLLGVCSDLTRALGIEDAVTFLGAQPHDVVQQEMRRARCFVQHSVEAADGDCEGTPVSVLEAGASGLPVVSTYHGGIGDVVIHESTGLLVNERDVTGMAALMIRLLTSPSLARDLGAMARRRIQAHYSMDRSLSRLWDIVKATAGDA